MICVFPLRAPLGRKQQDEHFPAVSMIIAIIALILLSAQWWYLSLPQMLQEAVSLISHGRLYVDPAQQFFHPLQIWSSVLFHADWWQLIPLLIFWCAMSNSLERQWGSLRSLLLYVVLAPIAASLLLIAGGGSPGFGLAPLALAAAGALAARSPGLRLQWHLWYLLPWALGRRLFTTGIAVPSVAWLAYEILRVAVQEWALMPTLLSVSVMLLSGSTSYLLVSLFDPAESAKADHLIWDIAEGRLPIDRLESALGSADEIPMAAMEHIAQRCIIEQRSDVARVLATYLALREPQHPSYILLRDFLKPSATSEADGRPPSA